MNSGHPQPILSILIPTRNRIQYVLPCIRHILAIQGDDLEVVVQDNSDTYELGDLLCTQFSDTRMRYNRTPERLDVVRNFNTAVQLSSGQYVCFIGDDDGVNPEILQAARWASSQGLGAILPTRPAQYFWPDLRFRHYGNRFSGSVEIKPFTGAINYPDAETELRKCARSAGHSFGQLPRSYYGIVKRTALDAVYAKTGTYFPGPSPDLAGAVSVAPYVGRFCTIDYPLFVPGSSSASTAGLGAMKKHEGRLEDFPHLPKDSIAQWSTLVPAFFSGTTIWAEDVVQALRATGREDVLKEFNVPLVHAMCAVFNPAHLSDTLKHLYPALRESRTGYVTGTLRFVTGYLYTWWLRVRALVHRLLKLKGSTGSSITVTSVPDIHMASVTLVEHLAQIGESLDRHLHV